MLPCLVPVLLAFYLQDVLNFKCKIPAPKGNCYLLLIIGLQPLQDSEVFYWPFSNRSLLSMPNPALYVHGNPVQKIAL